MNESIVNFFRDWHTFDTPEMEEIYYLSVTADITFWVKFHIWTGE